MTATISLNIADETGTDALGEKLAEVLPAGAVVALIGPLGSGKTRLVRAICTAAGVESSAIASPTYVLVHEYAGRLPVYHFDVYRLRDEDEFLALGPEEYFEGNGWTLIEWADRVIQFLPTERLEIKIESTGVSSRRFIFVAVGLRYQQILDRLNSPATS